MVKVHMHDKQGMIRNRMNHQLMTLEDPLFFVWLDVSISYGAECRETVFTPKMSDMIQRTAPGTKEKGGRLNICHRWHHRWGMLLPPRVPQEPRLGLNTCVGPSVRSFQGRNQAIPNHPKTEQSTTKITRAWTQ